MSDEQTPADYCKLVQENLVKLFHGYEFTISERWVLHFGSPYEAKECIDVMGIFKRAKSKTQPHWMTGDPSIVTFADPVQEELKIPHMLFGVHYPMSHQGVLIHPPRWSFYIGREKRPKHQELFGPFVFRKTTIVTDFEDVEGAVVEGASDDFYIAGMKISLSDEDLGPEGFKIE